MPRFSLVSFSLINLNCSVSCQIRKGKVSALKIKEKGRRGRFLSALTHVCRRSRHKHAFVHGLLARDPGHMGGSANTAREERVVLLGVRREHVL